MATTNYTLYINQGSDFAQTLTAYDSTGTARDITGYTGKAQLRRSYASTSNVEFTINIASPTSGNVVVTLSNAATANLKYGRYLYDLELTKTSSSTIERLYEGIAVIYPQITRAGA